jgi:hypothetical protein
MGWLVVSVLWVSPQNKAKEFEVQGIAERESKENRYLINKSYAREVITSKVALKCLSSQ